MQPYTTIDIDLKLYKIIEAARSSFEESPCEILLGLLGGPKVDQERQKGKAWVGGGVTLPHGTKLRMAYNGRQYEAEIADGFWLVEGERYNAPSAAAYAVARTKAGNPAHINGWIYWEAQEPGTSAWISIESLRPCN